MGFKRPTPIQNACIPAIMNGRDVMGCAETGSGKTAAFALPILQHLSCDPYGIFAVILTPTRELAFQIDEQFHALGAPVNVKTALIIGGGSIIDQSLLLSRRPHIIVATPGRLRHHIESADPPNLSKAKYLVLDEADRLLSSGFESELKVILNAMSSNSRQTLLFSATLTTSLEEVEKFAIVDTLRFDLTKEQVLPKALIEQYMFIPSQVKICYLVAIIGGIINQSQRQRGGGDINSEGEEDGGEGDGARTSKRRKTMKSLKSIKSIKSKGANHAKQIEQLTKSDDTGNENKSSIIVFVNTCKRCQLVSQILSELDIDNVALHSMMTQHRRTASLAKFKSQVSRILVCTDIASRGLDIPQVDVVINLDLPRVTTDYIHRVGRTARAGKKGRSLSLITPQEVQLIKNVEEVTKTSMSLSTEVTDDEVIPLLNHVAKAMKSAQLKLMEVGFDEHAEVILKRKKTQKRKQLRKIQSNEKSLSSAT